MSKLLKETVDLSALSGHAPELADMLVSMSSDIALVIDAAGVIERVALGGGEPMKAIADDWVGQYWTDTVTRDTRQKIEQLLAEVASDGISRVRQVNHPSPPGLDIPIAYSAVRLGQSGPLLAVGRDLSVVSAMQQRLLHAQVEMERDYWHRRQQETRYQLMFQLATDPVLVVDAENFRVIDANHAASRLLGASLDQLVGRSATDSLSEASRPKIEQLLSSACSAGYAVEAEAGLADRGIRLKVSVTSFRAEASSVLLIRLRQLDAQWENQQASEKLAKLAGKSPDGIVITDAHGRLSVTNPSFLELAQLSDEQQAAGRSLGDWVGNFDEILAEVRAKGKVPLVESALRGARGRVIGVELSTTLIAGDEEESFGFIIRAKQRDGLERLGGRDRAVH